MAEVFQLFENIVEHGDTRVDAAAAELAGAYAHSHACQNELVARCDPPSHALVVNPHPIH